MENNIEVFINKSLVRMTKNYSRLLNMAYPTDYKNDVSNRLRESNLTYQLLRAMEQMAEAQDQNGNSEFGSFTQVPFDSDARSRGLDGAFFFNDCWIFIESKRLYYEKNKLDEIKDDFVRLSSGIRKNYIRTFRDGMSMNNIYGLILVDFEDREDNRGGTTGIHFNYWTKGICAESDYKSEWEELHKDYISRWKNFESIYPILDPIEGENDFYYRVGAVFRKLEVT